MLASIVALFVWILVPITHEAVVTIRVRRPETVSSITTNQPRMTSTDFELFKQTQVDLIKGPFVLKRALNSPGISQLPIVQSTVWGGSRNELEKFEWLLRSLRVQAKEGTEMVRLSLRDKNSDQVKQVLDAVREAYISEVVDAEKLRQTVTRTGLDNRARSIREQIKEKTKMQIDIARRTGSSDLGENNNILALYRDRLRSIGSQKTRAELEADDLYMRLTEMNFRLTSSRRYKPSPTQVKLMLRQVDPEYALLEQELTDMKLRANAAGGLGGGQAQINQLEAKMQQIESSKKKQVMELLTLERGNDPQDLQSQLSLFQQQYAFSKNKVDELQKKYDALEQKIASLNQANADLQLLSLEVASLSKIEEKLSQDIEGLDLTLAAHSNIEVNPAQVPAGSSWMLNVLQIVGAWLLTLTVTMVGIAFWDFTSKRVNTTKDVIDEGELRVIGSLPMLNGRRAGGLLPMTAGMRRSVEIGLSRSIDSIRTALLYRKSKTPIEVVLVTSALGQEGKTTVASQLAVSVARSGRRALLIDADVRNPQQHIVLGMPFHAGLCELLRGDAALEDVVRATPAEGLWHLSAGYRDPQTDQHMASPNVKEFIDDLRSRFDMIIIDSGPVLTSPDSMLIGQYADVAIMSVRRDISRLPKVTEAADRLRSVGIEIAGAVVNGMNIDLRSSELQTAPTPASQDPQIESATAPVGAATAFDLDDGDESDAEDSNSNA